MMTKNLIYLLILTLVGCGAVKDFSKKSSKMLKTSKKLHGLSQQSTNNLCHAFIQGRQGNSSISRNENIELLKDKETDLGDKIKVASKFVQGMEFQLYAGNCGEAQIDRKELIKNSISEFIKVMSGPYEQQDRKVSALDYSKGKVNQYEQVMAAMAVSLHVTNRIQEENAKKLKFPVITFWEIIRDALIRHHQGQKPMFYEEELLVHSNYEMITQLLEYRAEMMLIMTLKELVDVKDMSFMEKVGAILAKKTDMGQIKLESLYLKRNSVTQKKINLLIQSTSSILLFGKSINSPIKIDSNLVEIFNHLDLTEDKNNSEALNKKISQNASHLTYLTNLNILKENLK